jgi:hypothetical protein
MSSYFFFLFGVTSGIALMCIFYATDGDGE